MQNKVRIAFCIERMDKPRGTERALTSVANVLCDVFDVTVVTSSQGDNPDFFELDSRIKRFDIEIDTELRFNSVFYNRIMNDYRIKLTRYLKKERFDVVVALSGLQFYFLHSIKDGSKKVAWFHFSYDISEHLLGNRFPSVMRKLLVSLHTKRRIRHARKYDKMVVVSKSNWEWWKERCSNVCFIYTPIAFSTRHFSSLQNHAVIAVGSLTQEKGFDNLIDAWGLVRERHPDWVLDIFGEGEMRSSLQNQIQNLNLSQCVFLKGRTAQIDKEYLEHSIFVLSSNTESFGLVLAEAAAFGLPLVAYKCKEVIGEIVENGKNGFLIETVGNKIDLADKVCALIEDDNLRHEMGRRAIETAKIFSIEELEKQWVDLLKSVV